MLPKFALCETQLEVIVKVYREKVEVSLTDRESQTIWCYGFFRPRCLEFLNLGLLDFQRMPWVLNREEMPKSKNFSLFLGAVF